MYVCVCNAVTDEEIRECAEQGTRSLKELGDALGVGTCCGRCTETAERVLQGCAAAAPQPTAQLEAA